MAGGRAEAAAPGAAAPRGPGDERRKMALGIFVGSRLKKAMVGRIKDLVELRAVVNVDGVPAETWLYRWTA